MDKLTSVTEDGGIKRIEKKELCFITADKLNEMELEKPLFLVEKILPVGLCILASPPKFGKSWFSLDLCISIASGTSFLGFKTNQAAVLYLALEDSNNRLQDRMRKVLNGRQAPPQFAMSINALDLGHGLIEQLENFIESNPETKLIVIDTFAKVRSDTKRGESAYTADYRDAGMLKSFADLHKLCLILVHHTKKMRDPSDTFANINGTQGLTGASDTMIIMARETRESETTKLAITGRDVEMQDYQIQFEKSRCRWKLLGTTEEVEDQKAIAEYENSPLIYTIKKSLEQQKDGFIATASEIISSSKKLNKPIYETTQKLGKSIEKYQDLLLRQDNIVYEPIKNGTGAKKHRFYYSPNPFLA